jgi:PAS domain S-box-containing protein
MKVYQFTQTQKVAVVAITGGAALVGWGINHTLTDRFTGWDGMLFTGAAAAAACAWVALRTSQRLWCELERHASELEISEERHRLLLEQASDAILVFEAKTGLIIEVNRFACDVLGWRADELVGQRHTVLHTFDEGDTMRRAFADHVKQGGIVEDDIPVRHRNGEIIPMHSRSSLVTAGAHRYVQTILRDLRPRLLAEDAVRRSEARLRDVLERAPVAIVEEDFSDIGVWLQELRVAGVTDLAAYLTANPESLAGQFAKIKVIGANPASLRAVGAPDLETYAKKMLSATTPEVLDAFRLELEAIWQGRAEVACDLTYRGVDGKMGHSVMHWSVTKVDDCLDLRRVVVVLSDLSELRATEARLREVQDRWELAVRALNVGIFEKNYVTGETFVSDRWKGMLGYAPDELPGDGGDWQARIHPDDHDKVVSQLQAHLRGENAFYRVEYRMLCKDGQYKWVVARGRAFFDKDGRPLRLIGAHTDISERKKAEAAVRASEARYRELFERTPVAILEEDFQEVGIWLRRSNVNSPEDLTDLIAKTPEALLEGYRLIKLRAANRHAIAYLAAASLGEQLPRAKVNPPESVLQAFSSELVAILQAKDETNAEVSYTDAHGREHHQTVRWSVARMEDGDLDLARVLVVLVDITEIRGAEDALAAERERLRVTLRAMAECLLTTDTDGMVQFMNEAAERLTGWTAGAAIGRGVEQVCVLRHEKTRANITMPVASAISEHRVVDFPLHSTLLNRQGAQCVVDGRCAPMHDLNGRAIGAVVVFRDVTERARLEAELLRSSKLESVGILAGGIAHDFNNILTVVMGNVTLAMLDSGVMAVAGRWLGEAERGVLRARDLTQQLLTFAKGGEPVRKTVQLPETVREVTEFALHGSKVRSEFQFDPDLWAADVDKGQIGQVVQNLVINAVQAMPEGGLVTISIHNEEVMPESARPLRVGKYLRLEIADTGMGIRAEHLQRIFDPYFTTKQSGSGLGLATVYSIVRRHQGHIDVESTLGQGTTFYLWLPAVLAATTVEADEPVEIASMSGRVLFMDDEETICSVASVLLQRLGFTPVTVPDGATAVAAYEEALKNGEPFRFVIMDLTVPGGMGGKEAMEQLLKIDPHVRAIVSSGYSSDPVLSSYRSNGFRGVVPKPYKLTDLSRTIRAVLEEKA